MISRRKTSRHRASSTHGEKEVLQAHPSPSLEASSLLCALAMHSLIHPSGPSLFLHYPTATSSHTEVDTLRQGGGGDVDFFIHEPGDSDFNVSQFDQVAGVARSPNVLHMITRGGRSDGDKGSYNTTSWPPLQDLPSFMPVAEQTFANDRPIRNSGIALYFSVPGQGCSL
ncbi:hypothetical protein CBL_10705 [Carabus blaptoides fortunei]